MPGDEHPRRGRITGRHGVKTQDIRAPTRWLDLLLGLATDNGSGVGGLRTPMRFSGLTIRGNIV